MIIPARFLAAFAVVAALATFAFAGQSDSAQAQQQTTIAVGDLWFCGQSFQGGVCDATITAGDAVVWNFAGAAIMHTVTECGASCDSPSGNPIFNSGRVSNSGTFSFSFDAPGTYLYHCEVHPTQMRGRIVVQAATATQPSGATPPGSATPAGATQTPAPGGGLPTTGQGPPRASSTAWWALLAVAGAFVPLAGLGALAQRRSR